MPGERDQFEICAMAPRRCTAACACTRLGRVGGRLHTVRNTFAAGQHAEAGGDLIEGEQEHVLGLARELGVKPVRILRKGFGFFGPDRRGKPRVQRPLAASEFYAETHPCRYRPSFSTAARHRQDEYRDGGACAANIA